MPRKIYLASSLTNPRFEEVLSALHADGHEVFDQREALPRAFERIDPEWEEWRNDQFIIGLECPAAVEGFEFSKAAIDRADTVVLLPPCGASSHLIAGYAAGAGKDVFALLPSEGIHAINIRPELMYKLFNGSVEHLDQLLAVLAEEREPAKSVAFSLAHEQGISADTSRNWFRIVNNTGEPLSITAAGDRFSIERSEERPLTFDEVTAINVDRCESWHNNGIADWSPERWLLAAISEAGEAGNALKKLWRIEDEIGNISEADRQLNTRDEVMAKVGEEIADTYLYLNLFAARIGLSIPNEVIKKFNAVSIKYGFPQRLRSEV